MTLISKNNKFKIYYDDSIKIYFSIRMDLVKMG